jgi:hypothetical protein
MKRSGYSLSVSEWQSLKKGGYIHEKGEDRCRVGGFDGVRSF